MSRDARRAEIHDGGEEFQEAVHMHQDDEYGKNVLDGFNQQLEAMKVQPASVTSYQTWSSDSVRRLPR